MLLIFTISSLPVFAADEASTKSYMHWLNKTVTIRPVFKAVENITLRSLGVEDFGTIVDIDSDKDGNIYMLSDNGTIISFNENFSLIQKYLTVDSNGEPVQCNGAQGIYVESPEELYIADTQNARVLICKNGVVVSEINRPESSIIPSDFVFKPIKVTKDSKGYLYILSSGCYYGALLFNEKGEFDSFFGANTVNASILTVFQNIWDRLTQNDIKRSKTVKSLPYQFADIYIDNRGFVYTCTGKIEGTARGQVRVLSPGGINILSGSSSINFGEKSLVTRLGQKKQQNFCSIQADKRGFIYVLDATYGLIYIYDSDANMITAFGGGNGLGTQKGVFSSACSMVVQNEKVFVADSLRNCITVFQCTDYGKLVLDAQEMTLNADYQRARPLWEKVLALDSQNMLALRGLAKAAFDISEYELAMHYAEECFDNTIYSDALSMLQKEFIKRNFAWIAALAVSFIAVLVFFLVYSIKHQVVLIRNTRLRVMFSTFVHPFNSFNDIKYRNQGSLLIACVLAVFLFISSVISVTEVNFRFTSFDAKTHNSLFQLVQTIGLVLLWSIAGWGASTLMEGKGKLKDIFIVTSYATLPLIVNNFISTLLSHIISSGNILSVLNTLAWILTAIILSVGLMVINDFSFPRMLLSVIFTILLMILAIFVIFMVGVLITEFFSFFMEIINEISKL